MIARVTTRTVGAARAEKQDVDRCGVCTNQTPAKKQSGQMFPRAVSIVEILEKHQSRRARGVWLVAEELC